jgi:hypothetical protein
MKATLEFDLPEDGDAHLRAVHAVDTSIAISNLDDELRSLLKFGLSDEVKKLEGTVEVLDWVRSRLRHHLEDYGVLSVTLK